MVTIYLYVNAALYAIFAAWCTIMPDKTASALGLSFRSGSGRSEYITVYGGLEAGVALFFLFTAMRPQLREAGLLFAILFYACLVLWRIPTLLFIPGIQRTTYGFAAGELALLIAAVALRFLRTP
jgi:hypothetical protein